MMIPFSQRKVTTVVCDANPYYPAMAEHQRYLEENPMGYCNHTVRFNWEEFEK